jgi:hypothetical protein
MCRNVFTHTHACVMTANPPAQATDVDVLQQFYETTLKALEKAKNDRLWFKTNLKLANLWFKKLEFSRLSKILKELLRYVC